jgi:hypothetical protein
MLINRSRFATPAVPVNSGRGVKLIDQIHFDRFAALQHNDGTRYARVGRSRRLNTFRVNAVSGLGSVPIRLLAQAERESTRSRPPPPALLSPADLADQIPSSGVVEIALRIDTWISVPAVTRMSGPGISNDPASSWNAYTDSVGPFAPSGCQWPRSATLGHDLKIDRLASGQFVHRCAKFVLAVRRTCPHVVPFNDRFLDVTIAPAAGIGIRIGQRSQLDCENAAKRVRVPVADDVQIDRQ